jgi:hypothetical protein
MIFIMQGAAHEGTLKCLVMGKIVIVDNRKEETSTIVATIKDEKVKNNH